MWTKAVDGANNVAGPTLIASGGGMVFSKDETAPEGLGSVTAALGPNKGSEITLSGLSGVKDNVGVTAFTVLYSKADDYTTASRVNLGADALTTGSYRLTGLAGSTAYYLWTEALDVAGNAAGPTALPGSPLTTEENVAPTGLSSVTAAPGGDRQTQILVSNLGGISNNVRVAGFELYYGTDSDPANAAKSGAGLEAMSNGSYTLSGLTAGTEYFLWTRAFDAAGNVAAPTPVTGGSVTTVASLVPPASYSSKTVYE